ncbi:MAG: hypothetical protein NVS3B12_29350 [Acidimicrobiales bacterium]
MVGMGVSVVMWQGSGTVGQARPEGLAALPGFSPAVGSVSAAWSLSVTDPPGGGGTLGTLCEPPW